MSTLSSHFLSPERSSPEAVSAQHARFAANPLLIQLLDAMPNGVVILNRDRQIVHFNQAFSATIGENTTALGVRPGEILNCEHAWENDAGCGTSANCATCGAARAIQSAQLGTMAMEDCRMNVGSGEATGALDLRIWATPLTMDAESFTIFAVNDISGEKRRKALERIFFHDIRNTAGAISGVAQLLELVDASDVDEVHGYGELLALASDQLLDEIYSQRQLLAAESGELAVALDDIDSLSFLQDLALRYRSHDVAEGRHLLLAATCEQHRVATDPALLGRIIGNMVKNALEATPVDGSVTISCEESGSGVRFWVHNPGFIPRNVQLQLFQRSFSTKGDDRGLGTFSMKLLAERYLGGHVDFISTRAGGTTFMCSLPR
jgi:signal transduction histidine kinase